MITEDNILTQKANDFEFIFSFFYDPMEEEGAFIFEVKNKKLFIDKSIEMPSGDNLNQFWVKNFIKKINDDELFKTTFLLMANSLKKEDFEDIKSNNIQLQKDILNLIQLEKKKKARFKDYAALKSGFDDFSKMKGNEIIKKFDQPIISMVRMHIPTYKHQISVLRWICRGLPLDTAIHKVKVDKEVHENANKYIRV